MALWKQLLRRKLIAAASVALCCSAFAASAARMAQQAPAASSAKPPVVDTDPPLSERLHAQETRLHLPAPANPKLPTLWLVGDSTVRNGHGDGANGQWGWGEPLVDLFRPIED
jgi:rhamnogalacturonan acetylesterase